MSWTVSAKYPFRSFERPLGLTELGFYWDSQFSGTADTLQHAVIESEDKKMLGNQNFCNAWIELKHRFPLLGSQLIERRGGEEVVYKVLEDRLNACGPEEIKFQSVSSLQEAQKYGNSVINGQRLLSNALPARLFILLRTDEENRVHILIHIAHCITDGIANTTILRCFLDTLSAGPGKWKVEDRLALAVASEDLIPGKNLRKRSRQRWNSAIGHVLASIRTAKITGGHTLPRTLHRNTPVTPSQSSAVFTSFTIEESARIITSCRENGVTFGNVLPVLGQIALTRILCRRFVNGEIARDEWEYRTREPMSTGGPLSLRPFLDRQWFSRGGSSNVSLAIGFFNHTLPFMPLRVGSKIVQGGALPEIKELLTSGRFWLRCGMVQQQFRSFMQHPRFLDILAARSPSRVERLRAVVLRVRSENHGMRKVADTQAPSVSVIEQGLVYGPVLTHGGSSFGNVDHLVPRKYPLLSEGTESPTLRLIFSGTQLRCRPAELYLGASMTREQLHINIFWDGNVYTDEVVQEWLDEVKGAVKAYLIGEPELSLITIYSKL